MLIPTAVTARRGLLGTRRRPWNSTVGLRPSFVIPGAAHSHPDCRCAGETGKEQVVQVHCDEGVATRIGPKPCAYLREEAGEASVGVRTGQPSSRENWNFLGADAFDNAEGNMFVRVIASIRTARRGRRTWHVRTLFLLGNREVSRFWPAEEPVGPHREGEEP